MWASLSVSGKSPKLNLTYPAFWETKVTAALPEIVCVHGLKRSVRSPNALHCSVYPS